MALLNLLQTRGQLTAAEAAEELEVSERTARRDLEALGMAGVPVYSQRGRNGGWRLLGGGRTDMSGLTSAETRALFLVAGPAAAATPAVRAALRKLVRALPEPFRVDAESAATALVIDPVAWDRTHTPERAPPPHLDAVQRAVVEGVQVMLGYVARDGRATSRVVHPLGLATKVSTWYLVAGTDAGLRTFRVERISSVEPTGEAVVRPDGFELAEAWRLITETAGERLAGLWVRGRAEPGILPVLRWQFGARLRIGPPGDDGRVAVEVGGAHLRGLIGQLAGFGELVVVDEPDEARAMLRDIGTQLSTEYT